MVHNCRNDGQSFPFMEMANKLEMFYILTIWLTCIGSCFGVEMSVRVRFSMRVGACKTVYP